MTDLAAHLRDLVIANRILAREGVLDAFGHVSIRHPEDPQRYVMARSRSPKLVELDDLMEFDLDSNPLDQRGRAMYSERYIHGCIYAVRPDVMAITHNHSPAVIPFGLTGTPLRPVTHLGCVIGPEVPLWDIADEFGDTGSLVDRPEYGQSLARRLGDKTVVLMRGHGCAVVSSTIRGLVLTSIYMQLNATLQWQAEARGPVRYMTPAEIEITSSRHRGARGVTRAWEYWCARAGFTVAG